MPFREDLLAPIAGDNPAGAYLRYDPVYDRIKEARREDLDLPQGGWQTALKTADWPLVIKLASEIIATRSKDLQLAAWLTEAALKRDGFAGLQQGLELLRRLLEEYWDHLYPELEEGDAEMRAAPLEWVGRKLDIPIKLSPLNAEGHGFADYTSSRAVGYQKDYERERREEEWEALMAQGKLGAEAFDAAVDATPKAFYQALVADLDGCLAAVEELDRVADERFGDDAPSFIDLRQALQQVRHVAGQLLSRRLESDPDPVEEAPMEPAADAGAPAPAPEAAASGEAAAPAAGVPALQIAAVPRTLDEASARVAAAARFLRRESPGSPAPYLILRGFRWGELRAGGPDPLLLVAPPTETRSALKKMLIERGWAELLEAGEEVMAMPYGRGWLDLQRYSITAADALGGGYEHLAAALRSTLRSLLHDIPWLATATLMDDTPTANAETFQWLRSDGLLAEPTSDGAAATPRFTPLANRDPTEQVDRLVRAGRTEQAIAMLMRQASMEQSERARFLRRLQAATIMVDHGMEAVALPMLQRMLEQIDKHELERWEEADTIAQPLALFFRCKKRLNGSFSDENELFQRISRLDPLTGMRLSAASGDGER